MSSLFVIHCRDWKRTGKKKKPWREREKESDWHGTTISILPALFSNDKTSCLCVCVCNYVISYLIHIPIMVI